MCNINNFTDRNLKKTNLVYKITQKSRDVRKDNCILYYIGSYANITNTQIS